MGDAKLKPENIAIHSEAQEAYLKSLIDCVEFRTKIPFISSHMGWRRGNLHLFIGTAGGGKSALMFQILIDLVSNNYDKFKAGAKILVYLSEETVQFFKANLVKMGMVGERAKKFLSYIDVISEPDVRNQRANLQLSAIEIGDIISQALDSDNYQFFILDNITTTDPYLEDRHLEISPLAKRIQSICRNKMIPFVVFAHTKGDVTGPGFSMEEIRQKKTITMIAEFCYLIHRFSGTKADSFLQVVKHRGYPLENWFFKMKYNMQTRIIDGFVPSDRDDFKDALKIYRGKK